MTEPRRVWPTGTDYTRSIQTPGVSFADPELAAGKPGVNAMGMPLVASGQNAVVFLLETERGRQAVRCFLTPPHEGAIRYAALEEHLVNTAPRALTAARWLPEGVSVGDQRWPVVIMPWVEGPPLNIAVEDMLDEPVRLRALATQWAEVVRGLQRARVAHGDLQHGNVLVKPGDAIALVDLDGVWVPEIKVGPPAEFGHPNYQHPHRTTQHWGQYVDSFPGALIELALNGLAADSSLDRFLHGENLLFMRSDLERPGDSEVWGALCSSPDPKVASMAALLRQRCAGPISDVLIPFDRLRDATVSAGDQTVMRAPAAAAPMAAPVAPVIAAPATTDGPAWWEQPSSSPSTLPTVKPATAAPPAPPPGLHAPTPVPALVGAPSGATKVSAWVRLGQNLTVAGLVGGVLAGIVASLLSAILAPAEGDARNIVFVLLVGLLLGGLLLSTQDIAGRNWDSAARRFGKGGGVGGLAGVVAIPLADAIVNGLAYKDVDTGRWEVPLGASVLMFMVVALLVGLALGALRSAKTAGMAGVAGALGGAVGGTIFGSTAASWKTTQLDIDFVKPGTILAVAIVTGAIGLAYGAAVRYRRTASLTIIEGTNSGMEIAVEGTEAVIGSGSSCHLVLRGDNRVLPRHAVLQMSTVPPELEPLGEVRRNGEILAGRTPVNNGDVVMIGGSFIRVEYKETNQ